MKNLVLNMRSVAKIRVLCLAALSLFVGVNGEAFAATYTVAQTGRWGDGSTWSGTAPSNTIDLNENITISVPAGMTLKIDEDVTITQNGLYIITLSGSGNIEIKGTSTFSLINNNNAANNEKSRNRVNLQCDIDIEENATLKLDVLNVSFDSEYDITGSGTIYFSRTGSYTDNRCRIQVSNLTKPITGCKFLYASSQKFTYEASSDYVLPGEYYDMGSRNPSMFVYDTVKVSNKSWLEDSGNGYISKSDKAYLSFNLFSNTTARPLNLNVDATLKSITNVSSLSVADTNTLTVAGDITWKTSRLPGIVIESGKTLTLPSDVATTLTNNVSIAEGGVLKLNDNKTITFDSNASISGAGTLNFAGSATINNLKDCLTDLNVTFPAVSSQKTIIYGGESTCILAKGDYYNLTLNSTAESITLCGDVNVTNNFTISRDQTIESGGTLTVANFVGNSKTFTSNVDVTVNNNISNGKFVVNSGRFTNNSDGKTITDLTVNSGAVFETTKTVNISNSLTNGGSIVIGSEAYLNIADGKTLTFSATGNPTISGAGTLNFAGAATINGLATCLNVNTITFPAVSNKKNITYGEESTCILAGVYYNLTLNSTAESITLCDDVNVTNNFTINGNHTLNGTGTLTAATITENGASLTNNVDITASNITINSEAFAFGEEGTGDLSIGTLKLGNDVTLSGRALTVSYLNGNSKKLTTNVDVTVNNENAGLDKISIEINNGSTFNRNCTGAITDLTVNSGGKFTTNRGCTINGTLTLNDGKYETNNDVTVKGILTLNGGEIEITESGKKLTAQYPIQVSENSTITAPSASGTYVTLEDTTINGNKKLTINGNVNLSKTITVNCDLDIKGNLSTNTKVDITLGGDVEIESGAFLNIADGYTLAFSNTPSIHGDGTLNFKGTAAIRNLTNCLDDIKVTFSGSGKTIHYKGTSNHIISATYTNLTLDTDDGVDSMIMCGPVTASGNFEIKNHDYKLAGTGALTITGELKGNNNWFKTYVDVIAHPGKDDNKLKNAKIEVNSGTFYTNSKTTNADNALKGLVINGGKFETPRSLIVSTPIVLNGGELKSNYKVQSPTSAINVTHDATISTSFQPYEAEINISGGAILSVATYTVESKNYADFSNKITGNGTVKVTTGSTLKLNDDEIGGLIVDNGGTLEIGQNMTVTKNATFAGTVKGNKEISVEGENVEFGASPTFDGTTTVLITGDDVATIIGARDCYTNHVFVADGKDIIYEESSNKILALADASGSYGSLTIEGTDVELCANAKVSGALTIANDLTITGTNKTLTINGSVVDASGAEEKKTITVSGTTVAISSTATEVEPKIDVVGGTLTHSGTAQLTDLTVDGSSTFIVKTGADVTVENPTLAGILTVETGAILTLTGEISLDNGLTINNHGTIKIGDGIVNSVLPCTFAVAENAKVTYGEGSTNILGGEYDKLTINSSNVTLCNNVTVGGAFAIAGNTEISSSEGIKALTLNGAVNAENKTITVNGANMLIGDAVAAVQGGMSIVVNANGSFTNNRSCTIAGVNVDGGSAAIGAQTTITNNLAVANGSATLGAATTVGGNISVASAGAVNVNATTGVTGNLSVADGGTVNVNAAATVGGDASLLGTVAFADGENKTLTVGGASKTVTFNHSTTSIDVTKAGNLVIRSGSTIAGLEDCYGFSFDVENPSIIYAASSTKVLTGIYTNLTINSSNIELCDNVTVEGALAVDADATLTGGHKLTLKGAVTGDKTITASGASTAIEINSADNLAASFVLNTGTSLTTTTSSCTVGSVTVEGGSAAIGAATTVSGNFAVNSGSATIGATTTVNGDLAVSGGSVAIAAATTVSDDFTIGGEVTITNTNVTVTSGDFIVSSNGAVAVEGSSTVTGNVNLAGAANGAINLSAANASLTVGGGTITIPAISKVSDVSKFHIVGTSTIAGLADCVEGLDISGNITYAASSPVIQVSDEYEDLTILGTNVSLCGDVIASGTLTWDSGIITLGTNNLTVGNISSSNAFGGTHMMVSGGLGEDAGQLTMTDLSGSVEFPVGTMAGSTAQYTPIIFSSITADATPSITVSTDNHTAEGGIDHDLKRTWTVSSSNVTSAKLDFKFVSADDPTHLSMGVAHNGTVMGGSVNNSTFTMTTGSAVSGIDGIWTAKLAGRFIYSYQSGAWDEPTIWTDILNDDGEPVAPAVTVAAPMSTDNVTIWEGHTVTAGTAVQEANTVNIFGTLNLGSQEANFQYLGGTGKLIQTGIYNVGGVYCNDTAFRAATGGTLELNGNFGGQDDFSFNNLILDNTSGSDLTLTLDADKGTMNGSLTLTGSHALTINGNFATATDGEI